MDRLASVDQTVGPRTFSGNPESSPGLLEEIRALCHELHGLLHDHVRLAALETRQAGENLVTMIAMGVIVAGLLLSAWLGLVSVAVLALIERGVMMSGNALLLAIAANLLVALILCNMIRHQGHRLQFPTTVQGLDSAPSRLPDTEQS